MSVMKETATQRLIEHIKSGFAVGKIATVDTALNTNSTNPVQNKPIAEAIETLTNDVEDATTYKVGDVINVTGYYPAVLQRSESNKVQMTIGIHLPKILEENTYYQVTTDGYVTMSNDKGLVKINGSNVQNRSLLSGVSASPSPQDHASNNVLGLVYTEDYAITDQDDTQLPNYSNVITLIVGAKITIVEAE